jgi:quercetin dioxygenase-like cupin family protein
MPVVSQMADLIEYQEGSVVSKQLIKRPFGSVTVFAFEKGEGLSEHTAPFDAMVQIIDGSATVTISKVDYPMKSGEMIIMPAGEPHALKADERFKMMLVMIRG